MQLCNKPVDISVGIALTIGVDINNETDWFYGYIDNIRLYSRVLT
jgi:hypothetical protein